MKVKFLVIRFSSIGDIVLTSPVVRGLKQQVENAEVHFVTKTKFACLVESNPHIDKVHLLDQNIGTLIHDLAKENFDYIIDLHNNFRSNKIKRRLKIEAFAVNKINWEKFLMIRLKVNRLPDVHIVDRYVDTASIFDVKNDNLGLDYFVDDLTSFKQQDLPAPFQNGYVAFVIAGTYFTKKLPIHKVSEICQKIPYPVILLGGKNEYDEGEQVLSQSKGNVLNFAGKITLNQSASLVREARVVLANDTGLMHIAAAFKKKILSFWGNTIPEFGMTPYCPGESSEIMQVNDLKCRPCSKLGHQKCPKKHFKCMEDISVEKAVAWIEKNY
ncbi:glycosyltransferase family 9 protein [Draconibacterium sp. IB214405]|uniref:glycosyltransferase family 9 protein n=1 Tax=Draconibacterium sp. IB214405 TaxID=3097352 RepID=UPI002A0DFDE3|nr:glycosyltransferase family 9 protein [Draconibacterium sp. IB214405]MDX8337612.1 glycosyltransferase family 9 protein [Draconibacterium sp. IB214405]